MKIIDSIFIHAQRPLVIVLQGDHGYRFDDPINNNLTFPNLHAVYFSNHDYSLMRPDLSMVNTFRVVLNTVFKQRLPLLQDSSIYLNYK